jgi:anti-sigma-K factor RskA
MMDDEHQQVQESLPAYALNALDEAEITAVAEHLDRCTECHTVLIEVQTVLGVLPYALPPHPPAPEMKARLLAVAAREKRPSPLPAAPPSTPAWWESLFTVLHPYRWAAIATLFTLLVGWNIFLQLQLGAGQPGNLAVDLASVPTGAMVPLTGTGQPGATARLYLEESQQTGILAVRGLPTLPDNRVYQLWFAHPETPARSGGVFVVNPQGETLVEISVPYSFDGVSAIAITEEPAPHSDSPTGIHLLDGNLGNR